MIDIDEIRYGKSAIPLQSTSIKRNVHANLLDIVNVANCLEFANQKGFVIYTDRPNIWGIRVPKGSGFNDIFIIFWFVVDLKNPDGIWKSLITYGTTEPSATYLQTIMNSGNANPNGVAILIADKQYIDCWFFGLHRGKYKALQQSYIFKFTTYRKKKDDILYYDGLIYTDVKGLNFHTTKVGLLYDVIGAWSEGCQVIKDAKFYFEQIIPVLQQYEKKLYSYTIVNNYTFANTLGFNI